MEERSKSILKSTAALLFKGLDDTMTKFDVPEAEYKELLPSRGAWILDAVRRIGGTSSAPQ